MTVAEKTARVINLSIGAMAFVHKNGDVSITTGGASILLRRREFLKLARAYEAKP